MKNILDNLEDNVVKGIDVLCKLVITLFIIITLPIWVIFYLLGLFFGNKVGDKIDWV